MEKRNVIESGRTPEGSEKDAEAVDEAAREFDATALRKEHKDEPPAAPA